MDSLAGKYGVSVILYAAVSILPGIMTSRQHGDEMTGPSNKAEKGLGGPMKGVRCPPLIKYLAYSVLGM